MKKFIVTLSVLSLLTITGSAFAENFDSLQGLTAVQKQQLSQAQFKFKQENDALNNKIIDYQSKLAQLNRQTEKTPEQVALIKATYERNIQTFKAQQEILKKQMDASYKKVMTQEQYQQYQAQQIQVQDAFANFLRK